MKFVKRKIDIGLCSDSGQTDTKHRSMCSRYNTATLSRSGWAEFYGVRPLPTIVANPVRLKVRIQLTTKDDTRKVQLGFQSQHDPEKSTVFEAFIGDELLSSILVDEVNSAGIRKTSIKIDGAHLYDIVIPGIVLKLPKLFLIPSANLFIDLCHELDKIHLIPRFNLQTWKLLQSWRVKKS